MNFETRILGEPLNVATRQKNGRTTHVVEGYAARFGVLSENLGGFRERISPGAFRSVLRSEATDVRALFNHDMNHVLGRQKNGTLELKEDDRGLFYRVELPDTQLARDLVVSMERGDIAHSSFAFNVKREGQSWDFEVEDEERGEKYDLRTVTDVAGLYDVSVVTLPAYPDASSGLVGRMLHVEPAVEEMRAARRAAMNIQASRAKAFAAKL